MSDECATCYGTGELVTEQGPSVCPDCFGDGRKGGQGAKVEWRLRQLEQHYAAPGENGDDVRWLIHELRGCREALTRILTSCLDADEADELARRVKFQANQALGIYAEVTTRD